MCQPKLIKQPKPGTHLHLRLGKIMETIGYLHIASLPKESESMEIVPVRVHSSFLRNFNWKKRSCSAAMPLVSVALTLGVLSVAGQALALQKAGNQDSQVTNIQRCLQKTGYFRGPVTGKFGSLTQNAVIQFQKAHGLTADGVVGSRTEQLIQSQCQSRNLGGRHVSGELQLGSTGSAVRRLQQDLRRIGFFHGPITGRFGSETQQAVVRFQQSCGLRSVGIVGPQTTEAIRVSLNQVQTPVSFDGDRQPPEGIGGDSLPNGINIGAAGSEVTELQQSLRQLGYLNHNPTGYYGPTTRDAVVRFQQANRITPNGVADSQTLAAITSALGSQNPRPIQNSDCSTGNSEICLGERSQRVATLQQRLQEWGFFKGNVNGYYGPVTRDAVAQFQRSSGIYPTGFVNYQTWQALRISNTDNSNNSTNSSNFRGGRSTPKNSYVVVVPVHNNDTLSQVRQYIPEAFTAQSRLGPYVNAGQFSDRSDAEKLSQALRSRGLDARVEYL